MKRAILAVVALLGADTALAGGGGPSALCYEVIGCVQNQLISPHDAEKLGCDQLWTVRNGIFAARGYCFQTPRGKEEFGNDGCRFPVQEDVPLNDFERANIRVIQSIERRRGC
jgi:hypothetical protein